MRDDELRAAFDQQAANYDAQWARMQPIRDALHLLVGSVFAELPADARVLCVGAGTGAEVAYLAGTFPGWRFTAVDPSAAMLDVCRRKAQAGGFASRCHFHQGYLASLPVEGLHDAATSFLVSQFLLLPEARTGFFREIADRSRPGGLLASADLAAPADPDEYERRLEVWFRMMTAAGIPPEGLQRMRAAYASDVAILPPDDVASILRAGGFDAPVPFFQAGLIHAWFSRKASPSRARRARMTRES